MKKNSSTESPPSAGRAHKPCGDCAKAQWKPIAECGPHQNVVMSDKDKLRVYGRFDADGNILDSGGRALQFVYHPVIFLDIPEEVFPSVVEEQPAT